MGFVDRGLPGARIRARVHSLTRPEARGVRRRAIRNQDSRGTRSRVIRNQDFRSMRRRAIRNQDFRRSDSRAKPADFAPLSFALRPPLPRQTSRLRAPSRLHFAPPVRTSLVAPHTVLRPTPLPRGTVFPPSSGLKVEKLYRGGRVHSHKVEKRYRGGRARSYKVEKRYRGGVAGHFCSAHGAAGLAQHDLGGNQDVLRFR